MTIQIACPNSSPQSRFKPWCNLHREHCSRFPCTLLLDMVKSLHMQIDSDLLYALFQTLPIPELSTSLILSPWRFGPIPYWLSLWDPEVPNSTEKINQTEKHTNLTHMSQVSLPDYWHASFCAPHSLCKIPDFHQVSLFFWICLQWWQWLLQTIISTK